MPAALENRLRCTETACPEARGAKAAPRLSPYVSVAVQFATQVAAIDTGLVSKVPEFGDSVARRGWHSTCSMEGAGHDLLLVTVEPSPGLMDMPPRRPGGG